jgi:hypothetical protein
MFRLGSPSPQYRSWKLTATFLVLVPLAVTVLFYSLMLLGMLVFALGNLNAGSILGSLLYAMLIPLLVFILLWFVYAMVVSLWWDRRQASIAFGLVFGWLLVSVCAVNVGSELLREYERGALRWPTLGFGYLFFSSWLLAAGLLLHSMYGRRRVG